MTLTTLFKGKCNIIVFVAIIFLAIVLFIEMILCSVFFTKIKPWFSHSSSWFGISYKCLYLSVTFSFNFFSFSHCDDNSYFCFHFFWRAMLRKHKFIKELKFLCCYFVIRQLYLLYSWMLSHFTK